MGLLKRESRGPGFGNLWCEVPFQMELSKIVAEKEEMTSPWITLLLLVRLKKNYGGGGAWRKRKDFLWREE